MKPKEDDLALAVWRYGIISPLLHRHPDQPGKGQVLADMGQQSYVRENGQRVALSPETIRKWLTRYRQGGLPALADKPRKDRGKHRIDQKIIDAMVALRGDHPRWTLTRMFEHMLENGIWNGRRPSQATLYRLAQSRNLQRDPHLESRQSCRSFAFDTFGQLWMADFLHGPKIRKGRYKRKTYLHVILDDSARYVVSGSFYLSEKVESLICDLMTAVRRFGIPERFYTDNGPSYASRHLKVVCARLGMQLIHTPPYRPQGRGKVERLFRTVREQFLAVDTSKTLEQLNTAFDKWLEQYHQRRHRSLKCSPLKKRLTGSSVCQPVPEVADIETLFMMQRRCRVYKDGTIRLFGQVFEILDPPISNKRLTVYYTPWDLSCVYYGRFYKPAFKLHLTQNAHRFDHP
jgi:transposase InsO family protein